MTKVLIEGREYMRVPNYQLGEIWWFDAETLKPVPDPTKPPEHPLTPEEILARMHEMADESDTVGKCYFIGGGDGPVKIGYSISPKDRLRALQFCSPVRLSILAVASGGMFREAAYHNQFADYRLHGEWFERSPEILAEIERLRSGSFAPEGMGGIV